MAFGHSLAKTRSQIQASRAVPLSQLPFTQIQECCQLFIIWDHHCHQAPDSECHRRMSGQSSCSHWSDVDMKDQEVARDQRDGASLLLLLTFSEELWACLNIMQQNFCAINHSSKDRSWIIRMITFYSWPSYTLSHRSVDELMFSKNLLMIITFRI